MNHELTPIQNKLLCMFKWLIDFLNSNHLTYYVVGGTMLGACRHNGFIPWDDDIDIGMPRNDYEKLLHIFNKRIEHYALEHFESGSSNYILSFAKVYDLNTSLTMNSKKPLKRGLFIDVFPIDGIGNYDADAKAKSIFNKISKLKRMISRKATVFKKDYGFKNIVYFAYRLLPFNEHRAIRRIQKLCQTYSFDNSKFVGNLVGSYFKKEIMKKDIFGKPSPYKFENIIVNGPEKWDEYLTHLYGDWRKLPPVEKRQKHDNTSVDLETPFSDGESPFND